MGVGYLDKLGWYNVTLMDLDAIIDRRLFLPVSRPIIIPTRAKTALSDPTATGDQSLFSVTEELSCAWERCW